LNRNDAKEPPIYSGNGNKESTPFQLTDRKLPRRRDNVFFFFFLFALLADQLSKALVVYRFGVLSGNPSFLSFLGDYISRFREFPWRTGADGYRQGIEIIDGFLALHLTTNTGAAFSIFANNPGKLAIVSAVLITLLYLLFRKWGRGSILWPIAFGLQIGGAFGNFIDRARLGEVVDFIATRVPTLADGRIVWIDFPIFNIADSCAVVGTFAIGILFISRDLRQGSKARKAEFELALFEKESSRFAETVHSIEHSEYDAKLLRRDAAPKPVALYPNERDDAGGIPAEPADELALPMENEAESSYMDE